MKFIIEFLKNLFKKAPESKLGKGGVPNPPDSRDYDWSEVGSASPPFNWNVGYDIEKELGFPIKTKNQGQSLSCGGQAFSYYGEVLEALNTANYEPRSAKFLYAQTFYPNGGSTARDNASIAIKQGWAKETILPSYENGLTPSEAFVTKVSDITDAVRQDASTAKGYLYAHANPTIDIVAQVVRDNQGAVKPPFG